MTEIRTVVVFGDSASVGFGTGGRSYPVVLAEALGAERVEVAARFGFTTREVLDEHRAVLADLDADLVIVQTGMADSLIHPGRRVQLLLERFAPADWHGVDGLEGRALYSASRRTRARQRLVSGAKTELKRAIVAATGGWTRMQPEEYGRCLDQLLTELEAIPARVVSIGLYSVDEHFFPRQPASTRRFAEVRRRVLERHPGVVVVDVDRVLHRWDDYLGDHGHWNATGHAAVAAEIVRCLRAADADPANPDSVTKTGERAPVATPTVSATPERA